MSTGTETRILEAAIELFAEHGYAASARKIAAQADSTTMTLYRAFRNAKEHLFTEALETVIKRSFDPGQFMLFIYEEHKPGSFVSTLREGLQRWYFAIQWYAARIMAHACLSDNSEWREKAKTALERLVTILATAMERQLPKGRKQEFDAHATAKSVIMLLFQMRWIRAAKTRSPKAAKEEAAEIAALLDSSLRGLAAILDDDTVFKRRSRG